MRLIPDSVSESVTVVPLPNYVEKYDISALDFMAVKRYQEKVNCDPYLKPVKFSDTIYCFQNRNTNKRFVSKTYFEPRVKPRKFSETIVVFPKHPEKTYVACLDFHIDECRKWFRTSMEFTAKTITTRKIKSEYNVPEKQTNGDINHNIDFNAFGNEPGASQILLPRFGQGLESNDKEIVMNGDIGYEDLYDQIYR